MRSRRLARGTLFVVCLIGLSTVFWGCAKLGLKGGGPGEPPSREPAVAPAPGQPAPPGAPPPPGPAQTGPRGPAVRPGDTWKGTPSGQPAAPPSAAGAGAETKYFVHTVRYEGESVSIIAGWYLGDIMKYQLIVDANANMNPKKILKGDRIRIPENIMVTTDPMPESHVEKFVPKARRKAKPPQEAPPAAAPGEEEPALFGPKK